MRSRSALLWFSLLVACGKTQSIANEPAAPIDRAAPFDAGAAWEEFEQVLRTFYAYLERDDLSVDDQLAHSRELALEARDARALRSILHRTSFAFTDPHFLVGPFEGSDPNVIPTSSDLVIALHDDAFVVADVRADSAADEAGIRPGWQLLAVDGRTVDEAIEEIWGGVVLARTPRQRAYAATLAANGRQKGLRSLELRVDGKSRTFELPNPRTFAETVARRPPLRAEIRDGLGIIRFENSLGRLETIVAFDQAIESMANVEVLVLDLRNTPSGGNTDVARAVIGHFVTDTRPYQVHEIPAVERRTGVPRRFVEQVKPRAPHHPGRVVVVGGRWTGSMGEGLVIGMHAAAGTRTFASDMGDLLGALHGFDLELSGARLEIGGESLFHVDGTPREHFVADIALPTADRDAQGGDPALAAVRAWLTQ